MKKISEVSLQIAQSTEIAVVEQKPLSQLAKALQSPKVVETPEAKTVILALITKAEMELNFKPMEATQRATIAKATFDDIQKDFKTLRMEELPMIFHGGARGEFGEFFGLSVVTFHKWIKTHVEAESRRAAVIELHKSEPVTYKQPTKAEAERMFVDMWRKRIAEFKTTGIMKFDNPYRDYKALHSLALIRHTKDEKDMFMEEAKHNFKVEFERNRKVLALGNKIIYFDKKNLYDRIIAEDEKVYDEPAILNIACELAIKDYFKTNEFAR